jgi:DNA-binding MarR family transcriptional regulator
MVGYDFLDRLDLFKSGNTLKLYLYLRKCINIPRNANMVYPSYADIRRHTGLTNKAIKKSQDELVELGFITVEKRFNDSNKYYLLSDEIKNEYYFPQQETRE